MFLNSKISGIAIKCYKEVDLVILEEELTEVECPASATQCYKGSASKAKSIFFAFIYSTITGYQNWKKPI